MVVTPSVCFTVSQRDAKSLCSHSGISDLTSINPTSQSPIKTYSRAVCLGEVYDAQTFFYHAIPLSSYLPVTVRTLHQLQAMFLSQAAQHQQSYGWSTALQLLNTSARRQTRTLWSTSWTYRTWREAISTPRSNAELRTPTSSVLRRRLLDWKWIVRMYSYFVAPILISRERQIGHFSTKH